MLEKIINNIEEYIKYCKDNGASRVELSQEVLREIPVLPFELTDNEQNVVNSFEEARNDETTPIKQEVQPRASVQPTPTSTEQVTPQQAVTLDTSIYSSTEQGINDINRMVASCFICGLGKGRINTVPGEGALNAEIMFVGEAPGADEDECGSPFVGKAGQLLTKMLEKLGMQREKVYIANIIKCRPPNNRKPDENEVAACLPYIKAQIDLIKPKVIVALGGTAVNGLFPENFKITKQRGNWMDYNGIPVMPTYHPLYLLRAPKKRWETWDDMIEVFKKINKTLPEGIK
ncbi:MAG: uracil-DNA glycosylase [Kiritimatiellae bacterium]|jgi:uracil-DNA glycosylase family 4|nr:uracil-DNA glycosylase [Kiritimatiellia bacterium]